MTRSNLSFAGLHFLRDAAADQQAHPGSVYGQPRALHEAEEARHHRGAADEGSGTRGEARQTGREVSKGVVHEEERLAKQADGRRSLF